MDKDKRKYVSLEKYRRGPNECQHRIAIVDEEKAEIECSECGEKLDPIKYLAKLADREGRMYAAMVQLRRDYEKVKEKTRCKCQHCGQMTRIDKTMPSAPKQKGFTPKVVK